MMSDVRYGDPTHADATLGKSLWGELVEEVAKIFNTFVREPI